MTGRGVGLSVTYFAVFGCYGPCSSSMIKTKILHHCQATTHRSTKMHSYPLWTALGRVSLAHGGYKRLWRVDCRKLSTGNLSQVKRLLLGGWISHNLFRKLPFPNVPHQSIFILQTMPHSESQILVWPLCGTHGIQKNSILKGHS